MKLNRFKPYFLTLLCTMAFTAAFSQPPGGPPPGGGGTTGTTPPCWSPPCIPIDGGIGILLAAGAVIGARRLYRGTPEE